MKRNIFYGLLLICCLVFNCLTPKQKDTVAETLEKEAIDCYVNGNYGDAEALLLQVLEMKKTFPPEGRHPEYAVTLNNLANTYHDKGDFGKAELFYQQALDIRKNLPPAGEHSAYARSLNDLAGLYEDMGNYNKAEPLYLRAMDIQKDLPPAGKHPDYAGTLDNLGYLYHSMGNYGKAEALYKQALDIRKDLSPAGKHPDYASSLNSLAVLYKDMGNYHKAELLYSQVSAIYKALQPEINYIQYAASLNNLAELYRGMGIYDKAEPLYLQVIDILKTLPPEGNLPYYVSTLNNLALLYKEMGAYYRAEPLYLQVLDIGKTLPPEGKHPQYAIFLNNLAGLYTIMGNYRKAEPLYLQALEIFRNLPPEGKHIYYAKSLNRLAGLYQLMKDFTRAEPLYHQVLKILEDVQPQGKHPDYAASLTELAGLYRFMGDFSKAEPLYLQALDILKMLPPEGRNPDYGNSLVNLSQLYQSMGNYTQVAPLCLEALEIYKTLPPAEKHPEYAHSLSILALLYEAMGEYSKAEPAILESLAIYREFFHTNYAALSEKEMEHFLATLANGFEYFYSFLEKHLRDNPQLADTAADLQLFSRAILFRSAKSLRSYFLKNEDNTLSNIYDSWLTLRCQINKAYELTHEQRIARHIDLEVWEEEANKLEKSLITGSEEFRLAYEQKEYSWQEIRSALEPGAAVLNFVRYRLYDKQWTDTVHYAVIIIKADAPNLEIIFLEKGNQIEEEIIPLYRNFIDESAQNALTLQDAATFQTLYTYLWEPLAEPLDNVLRIYFLPDGMFNLVNPATLQWSSGNWLGEKWEIIRVSSLQDLVEKPQAGPENFGPPLLIGDPLFELDGEAHMQAVEKYSTGSRQVEYEEITYRAADFLLPLPGTRDEVQKLARLFNQKGWSPEIRLQEAAIEECIKAAVCPRVLHLATHAFFQEDLVTGQEYEDPMLRSGLLLSGAADTLMGKKFPAGLENGILTAREILDLDLLNTELVVLSACKTGLGVIRNGEGVYGMQRAFLVAGAGAVLMSLWKVDDQAACDFMVQFYNNWLSGKSKRESYTEAVIWMKNKYPAPFYWGAFILIER